MELTKTEQKVIKYLRELPAYAKIEIHTDNTGKKNKFRVHVTQDIIISNE